MDGKSPTVLIAITIAYLAVGFLRLSTDANLNDEGLLTWILARWLWLEPIPALFYLKTKPLTSLLNLPGAVFGYDVFFLSHLVYATAGIAILWLASRRFGYRHPWIPAAAMAASQLYVAGGQGGLSNVDGVVFASLALWSLGAARPGFWAGLCLGCLPLARFELALFSLFFGGYALHRGSKVRVAAGLCVVPLSYWLAGAAYHGDLAWFVTFPPGWVSAASHPELVGALSSVSQVRTDNVARTLMAVTPALLFFPVLPFLRPTFLEWTGIAFTVACVAVLTVLPLLGSFAGFSERYYLPALPVAALLAGRLVEARLDRPLDRWMTRIMWWTTALAVAGCLPSGATWKWMAAAVCILLSATTVPSRTRLALVAVAFLAIPALLPPIFSLERRLAAPELEAAAEWLGNNRRRVIGRPVYTNLKELDAYLNRSGRVPGLDVRALLQPEIISEIVEWTNPRNGQRKALLEACERAFYGKAAHPRVLEDPTTPAGSILVLTSRDERVFSLAPRERWESRTRVLSTAGSLTISELVAGGQ